MLYGGIGQLPAALMRGLCALAGQMSNELEE